MKTIQRSVLIEEKFVEEIKKRAVKNRRSFNGELNILLEEVLDKNSESDKKESK